MAEAVEEEEAADEECPKCPPVGAPAWMATFADLATLLMAFFVLLLSFADTNVPKFKMITGSLQNAFGVQREVPIVEPPMGTTVISMDFSPSPSPSLTETMTQETTEIEQPELKIPSDNKDAGGADQNAKDQFEGQGPADKNGMGDQGDAGSGAQSAQAMAAALAQVADQLGIEVDVKGDSVVVKLAASQVAKDNQKAPGGLTPSPQSGADQPNASTSTAAVDALNANGLSTGQQSGAQTDTATAAAETAKDAEKAARQDMQDLGQRLKMVSDAIENAKLATGKADQEVLIGGLEQELADMIAFLTKTETQEDTTGGETAAKDLAARQKAENKAESSADELRVSLAGPIGQGLVEVERRDGKVFVTVGSGGAFPSGSAELTAQAQDVMNQISEAVGNDASTITVSGHTDDVPISFGALYRDNWDLAAARASSVVQALQATGIISAARMRAVSYGETKPVESNLTPEGREKNRRIEIEIDY